MDQRLDEENEIETQRRINRRERIDTTDEYHTLEEFPDEGEEGEEMKIDTENEHEEDKEDDKDGDKEDDKDEEETEGEKQEEKNKKETLIYPCAVCGIVVKKKTYGVRCDIGCGKWCHRKCSGLASINDWRSNTYKCPKCIQEEETKRISKSKRKR